MRKSLHTRRHMLYLDISHVSSQTTFWQWSPKKTQNCHEPLKLQPQKMFRNGSGNILLHPILMAIARNTVYRSDPSTSDSVTTQAPVTMRFPFHVDCILPFVSFSHCGAGLRRRSHLESGAV